MDANGIYFGIDINEKYTMISYYQSNMDTVETISTVMGAENYQIPTVLAKRNGMGQWFFGNEAKKQAKLSYATLVDDFYQKAFDNEEIVIDHDTFSARDLLVIFLKQTLSILGRSITSLPIKKIVITTENVNLSVVETFSIVMNKLGIDVRKLSVIDYRESFYYYVLNQSPEIFLHDVFIFDYSYRNIKYYRFKRNLNVRPQVVNITEGAYDLLNDNLDESFCDIIDKCFAGKVVSCVYLIGDGFEGEWMVNSLNKLCKNRRVFKGNNLYTKGATYAGYIKDENPDWPYVYMGENELRFNLSLKVMDSNEMKFLNLVSAGQNWYDSHGECEVILDGDCEVEIWIHKPDSREAKVEVLELTDLPKREPRTTRLRINAKALSEKEVEVSITDLGFGEIIPGTKKVWTHNILVS